MPFIVRSNVESEVASLRRLAGETREARRSALASIGAKLVQLEKQHFDQLTRTGSSNGVTWAAMKPSTLIRRKALQRRGLLSNADPEQLGVMSGELRASFGFRVKSANQVRVINTAWSYGFFVHRRPVYPATMPPSWIAASDAIVQEKLNESAKRFE